MPNTEEFRRSAPPPLGPRPLNIPEPRQIRLENGLQVVVVEDDRLPLVSLRLSFPAGTAGDPEQMPGLTSMMTSLLAEGTTKRTSRQIADQVAELGATLTAGANSDFSTVAASALSGFTDEIFELMADITLNPTFPEAEVALARENTKQALIQQRAQPSFLASEQVARILFGKHPYAIIGPSNESVDAITQAELLQFHKKTFVPHGAVLTIVGDIRFNEIITRAKQLFGDWAGEAQAITAYPSPPERSRRTAHLVDRPGSEQSNIVIANTSISRDDPDFFPMLVMHTILGANASSRLFMNLREEKGYTYGAYSTLDARKRGGSFRASAEVRTDVTTPSLNEFFYELDRIRNERATDKELEDAKSYLTGVFPIRLETQEGLTDQFVNMKMFDLPADYLITYRDKVNAVSAEEVQRVARQHLSPEAAAIVIVGDVKAISQDIPQFADEVEVYDANGRKKENGVDQPVQSSEGFAGSWDVKLKLPTGQDAPAMITIGDSNSGLTGTVSSQFGDAEMSNIQVDGDNLTANLQLAIMGQRAVAKVGATLLNNDEIHGSLDLDGFPEIIFQGHRAAN